MAQEMVDRIRKAEAESLARQQAAKDRAASLLQQAQKQAAEAGEKALATAKANKETALRRVAEEGDRVKAEAAEAAQAQCAQLRETAAKRRETAICLATEQLLG